MGEMICKSGNREQDRRRPAGVVGGGLRPLRQVRVLRLWLACGKLSGAEKGL